MISGYVTGLFLLKLCLVQSRSLRLKNSVRTTDHGLFDTGQTWLNMVTSFELLAESDEKHFAICGSSNSGSCDYAAEGLYHDREYKAVRCCADAQLTDFERKCKDSDPAVYGESSVTGVCHDGKTWEEAKNICKSVGARLCTSNELKNDCTRYTGCNFDHELIWSSTVASGGKHYAVCSSRDSDLCDSAKEGLYQDSDYKAVRCCADAQLTDFEHICMDLHPAVYGESNVNDVHDQKTWEEAKDHCESVGARLCTIDELWNKCTKSTVKFDHELIWSSTTDAIHTTFPAIQPTFVPTISPTSRTTPVPTISPTVRLSSVPTVSPTENPSTKTPVNGDWQYITGSLTQVAVSGDGSHVCGVDSSQKIWYRSGVSGDWQGIAGPDLTQIAVSGDGLHVWGCDSSGNIYYLSVSGYNSVSLTDWQVIGGWGKQGSVSEDGSHVWLVNAIDRIWYREGAGERTSGEWERITGSLTQVVVSEDGSHVWGVDSNDDIYYRAGYSGDWQNITGHLIEVAVSGDGSHVWGVDSNDDIYYRAGVSGDWQNITGPGLTQIAVSGDGLHVWGVDSDDEIWYRAGV